MGQNCTFSEKLEKVSRKLFTWTGLKLKLIIIDPYEKGAKITQQKLEQKPKIWAKKPKICPKTHKINQKLH